MNSVINVLTILNKAQGTWSVLQKTEQKERRKRRDEKKAFEPVIYIHKIHFYCWVAYTQRLFI